MCVSTGNKYLDIGLAIAAAVATSGASLGASATTITGAAVQGASFATQIGVAFGATSVGWASAIGGAVMGIAGSVLMPPEQNYESEDYAYNPIAYNSQENQVTGSGGTQAAAVLSSEIKKAKSKRAKQQEQPKQDSYINTESFANSGLQIA